MYLKRNVTLFYAIEFFMSCIFYIPIRYFFFVNYLEFGIGIAILIKTLMGLVEAIIEVPSGGWADRFGRKKLFIIGMIFFMIGFSIYLFFREYYFFLFSAICLGVGYAITSGNLEALIHDNLEEEGKGELDYNKIQSNQYIILFIGRALSSLVAGYMFFYAELLPYIATIIAYIIAFILLLFIHSPKQEISKETNDFTHIKKALVFLKDRKHLLIIIFFIGVVLSGIGNIYWFTYQPYLEKIGINLKDIGIIYFFVSMSSAIGSYIIKKINGKVNTFNLIKYMLFGLFIISCMFYYINNIFGLLPIMLLSIGFGFVMIIGNTYLIKVSPKTHKSTILSIFSFSVSIGYFFFGSISGYIVQLFSLSFLYAGLPFLILFFIVLYLFLIKIFKV